jgi:zinc transporter
VGDETLGHACEAPHDWLWLHLALSDHRARRFIETMEAAPPDARALLLSGEDRIQLHLTDTGAYGILPDIERDFADHSLGSGRFAFWLDGQRLITARRHPLRAAEHLRDEIVEGRVPQSPAAALARLPEHFAALVEARLVVLQAELARIEDEVLADRFTDNRKLGALRRELSRYAREFSGLRSAIHRVMSGRHTGLSSPVARSASAGEVAVASLAMRKPEGGMQSPLLEQLPILMQDVEDFDRDAGGLTDRARLIYEEIETRIASTTNRSLAALTVASTLLLPPTFVAGLFGMNVGGIPWATEKEGFWIVIAFCAGLIVFSYAMLRRFRILP